MKQIYFATTNVDKLAQFQFVTDFYRYPYVIVSAYAHFPQLQPYSENYHTHMEIVEKGAYEIYKQINYPIIVEDSILEVEALENRPGLTASEYLKEKGRQGLLAELKNQQNRNARLTSIVGYYDGTLFILFKHVVNGSIAEKESFKPEEPGWIGPSEHPFGGGYNSIFIPSGTTTTFADMTKEEGITKGYREPNFRALLQYLTSSSQI